MDDIDKYFPAEKQIENALKNAKSIEEKLEIVQNMFNGDRMSDFIPPAIRKLEGYSYIPENALYTNNKSLKLNKMNNIYISRALRNSSPANDVLNINMHCHDHIELIYVYSGTLTQEINGERKILRKSDVCILDTNTLHAELATGEEDTIIFIKMSEQFFEKLFNFMKVDNEYSKVLVKTFFENKKNKQYISFEDTGDDEIRKIVENIIQEYFEAKEGYIFIIRGFLMRMLSLLIHNSKMILNSKEVSLFENKTFMEIDQYLKTHTNISRDEIATIFNFSPIHIHRIIKKNTGKTFTEYIQEIKLEKAKYLIENSELSIGKIIEKVGYSNRNHFNTLFKEKYGMIPGEYKDNYHK